MNRINQASILRDIELKILIAVLSFIRTRLSFLSQSHPWARPGVRVFHQKFGYGHLLSVQRYNCIVVFDKVEPAKVVADSFLEKV